MICSHSLERWRDLNRAVRSVRAQRRGVAEVVVVADDEELRRRAGAFLPTDERREWPRRIHLRVVGNAFTPGLSGARNTGLTVARANVVAFLDDDAVADRSWLDRLLRAYDDERVLACAGAVVPADALHRPAWWPSEFDWVVGCSDPGLPRQRASVRNVIGANMSVRRTPALAVGGFSSTLGRTGSRPSGCEETDLCIRLVQRWPDARVVYEPGALVHQSISPSRFPWRYFASRCYGEGRSKATVSGRVGAEHAADDVLGQIDPRLQTRHDLRSELLRPS